MKRMTTKTTHLSRKPLPEDAQFKHGQSYITIEGNRVIIGRMHKDGWVKIVSDELIPDEFMVLVMEGLEPVS